MWRAALMPACSTARLNGALKGLVIQVMATHDARYVDHGQNACARQTPKTTAKTLSGARILPLKGDGKGDAARGLARRPSATMPVHAPADHAVRAPSSSGNISARSLEPLPSRTMIVP